MYTIKIDKCAKFHVETRMQGSMCTQKLMPSSLTRPVTSGFPKAQKVKGVL